MPKDRDERRGRGDFRRGAVIIVGAGLVVRLLLMLLVDPVADPFGGDSAYYAAGHWDGFRPPLYTAFLALTLPAGLWLPLVVQCALTLTSAVAAFALLRNFWAGLAIAVCPFFAVFDLRLLSECFSTNFLWLGWLLLRRERGLGAGLLVGCCLLTSDIFMLLPALAAALIRTRAALIMAAVSCLMFAPWWLHAGTSPRAGLTLWIGTWERSSDWYADGLDRPQFPAYAFASNAERVRVLGHWHDYAELGSVAAERIRAHPVDVARTWVRRYPQLWLGTRTELSQFRAERFSPMWKAEKAAFYGLNVLLLLFGLWGLLRPDGLFVPPILYVAMIYVPFHAEVRYTLPALPFLIWMGVSRATGAPRSPSPA